MSRTSRRRRTLFSGLSLPICFIILQVAEAYASAPARPEDPRPTIPKSIDFNRDVRPILADYCYACHGPDPKARKAKLRLDTKEGLESDHIVVAGNPDDSELYLRVVSEDDDDRMPPPKTPKRLDARQKAILKRWIEQGAVWKGHWAYIPPVRPEIPAVDDPGFSNHPIDRFIRARQKELGLKPADEADRTTLIRRLSFDLVGLPPTKEEVEAFRDDRDPKAYEKLVDRLLASPHYGENMALPWLDLVRYADTIGYHSDNPMNVAPYRDYVVNSLNENKPFDQFTIEQIAGDLLPEPTTERKVASAYNRLLQTTEEGGAQAKEYMAKYAADRVRDLSTVWLAGTVGCAECHDHKFDPYKTRDFYQLAAFFADVQEAAVGRREPGMPVPSKSQEAEWKRLDREVALAESKLNDATARELAEHLPLWESAARELAWEPLEIVSVRSAGGTSLRKNADGTISADPKGVPNQETYTILTRTLAKKITGLRVEALADPSFPNSGPGLADNGNFVLTELKLAATSEALAEPPAAVALVKAAADHSQDGYAVAGAIDGRKETGWAVLPKVGKSREAVFELAKPIGGEGESILAITLEFQSVFPRHQIGRIRFSISSGSEPAGRWMPEKIREAFAADAKARTPEQHTAIAGFVKASSSRLRSLRDELAALKKTRDDFVNALPKVLITVSGPPRTTRILPRGNWLDESGESVEPDIPAFLRKDNHRTTSERLTRLDLARWIVSRENPLTARVAVNRLWKQFFGTGLSKTVDDLGSQGEWPTHPELLDWLAVEFMERNWDLKRMVRLLVTSQTYRLSSTPTLEQNRLDPFNRYLSHQGRWRLDAELVRDNALSISGLLSPTIGGPAVFPYQPEGYWDALNFPPRTYRADKGPNQYRRGIYTHRQRTFPHPSLAAFDAPSREECVAERTRSNIPQQALVLLNDPTYVEAARAFAERIVKEGGASVLDRLRFAFETAVSRRPTDEEAWLLADLLVKQTRRYARDKPSAEKLLAVGDKPAPKEIDPAELAAWTSVARTILNLHETIMRY